MSNNKRTVDTRFFILHFTADNEDLKTKCRKMMRELEKEQFETLGRDTAERRLNIIMQSGFEITQS